MRRKLGIIFILVSLVGAVYGQSTERVRKHELGFTLGYLDNLNEYVNGGVVGSLYYSYFINSNLGIGLTEYVAYNGLSKSGDDYYNVSYLAPTLTGRVKLSDRFTGLVKGNVGLVFGMQGEFDNSGSSDDLEVEAALGFGVGASVRYEATRVIALSLSGEGLFFPTLTPSTNISYIRDKGMTCLGVTVGMTVKL